MGRITISDIEDRWINEKVNEDLTDLPEGFYDDVASYVAELEMEMEDSEGLREDLLGAELKHVLEMVHEIYLFRTFKMMDVLFERREPDLLQREREAFNEVKERIEDLRKDLIEPIVEGESELRPPRETSNFLILILSEVPEQITGSDMRYYGPFKRGDVVNIPKRSADLLVDQGLARRLQIKEA